MKKIYLAIVFIMYVNVSAINAADVFSHLSHGCLWLSSKRKVLAGIAGSSFIVSGVYTVRTAYSVWKGYVKFYRPTHSAMNTIIVKPSLQGWVGSDDDESRFNVEWDWSDDENYKPSSLSSISQYVPLLQEETPSVWKLLGFGSLKMGMGIPLLLYALKS